MTATEGDCKSISCGGGGGGGGAEWELEDHVEIPIYFMNLFPRLQSTGTALNLDLFAIVFSTW